MINQMLHHLAASGLVTMIGVWTRAEGRFILRV